MEDFELGNTPSMLQTQAYVYLKKKIFNDEMQQGVFYSETKLSKELGISRTPLRQALHRLSQDGYLQIAPGRGFILRKLTGEDLRETIETRCAIEGFCTYQLVRTAGIPLRHFLLHVEPWLADMQKAAEENDVDAFAKADHRFHWELVKSANNREFNRIFQRLMYFIHLTTKESLHLPGRLASTMVEHEKYITGLKKHDVNGANEILLQHLLKPIELLGGQFPKEEDIPW